ncbi:nucleoporin Nup186/Nup192/Nup205 [Choanephora cucurbitarum]|nr:nucleoporin Nup186/Nup192/Nup205 [Choanephora cucurbitarum]
MSLVYSIPTWVQENQSLHDIIYQARVSKLSADALNQHLQLNKEKFIHLLNDEPKNPAHRTMLNSKKTYIQRTLRSVSQEFVTKALFLSDQLNINEYVAATLLTHGTAQADYTKNDPIDTAVLLYHQERSYLLACLDLILKSIKDASIPSDVQFVCSQFMTDLLKEGSDETYVSKLLNTLNQLTQSITAIMDTGTIIGQVPAAGSGKLGESIAEYRMSGLNEERIVLAQIIYHISSIFKFETNDTLSMLYMLEEAELTDPATAYMLMTMLSVLSHSIQTDLSFIDQFHQRIMTSGSRVPVIKAVIVLQWVLYLMHPTRRNQTIGSQFNMRSESVMQQLLDHALEVDVFRFMSDYLLYFQQPNAKIDTDRPVVKSMDTEHGKQVDKSDYRNINADIHSDFQEFVVFQLQQLALEVIQVLFDWLQKLKYKEEDSTTPASDQASCRDLQYFLQFLASVFRGRIDQGVIFWDRTQNRLHHFVRWLLDIHVVGTVGAAFDFFASIATGDQCALQMFHFFKNGTEPVLASSMLFSWGKPLAALQYYEGQLKDKPEEVTASIPNPEEYLLLKFLEILKQCVQYSQEARCAFWADPVLQCQPILIHALNRPTSTHIRAALFDVLAAFCSSWGGGVNQVGRTISRRVWKILEGSTMLISQRRPTQERMIYQKPGILQELELERKSRVYTETLAIIRLIGTAIHTQSKREAIAFGFNQVEPSMPSDLGKGSKSPGSIPYINLVIDHIFLSLRDQKYLFAEARWELTEACLMVFENSIACLDLSDYQGDQLKCPLPNFTTESKLLQTIVHPGFQVMTRILAGGRVIDELFRIMDECAQRETKDTIGVPYHRQCLIRVLRILSFLLDRQDTLMKVVVPQIASTSKQNASSEFQLAGYTFMPLPSLAPLSQLFLFQNTILVRLALLVNYEESEQVCYLATRILHKLTNDDSKETGLSQDQTALSQTAYANLFSNLASGITSVLSSSDMAERIVYGFSQRLLLNIAESTTYDDFDFDFNSIPFWLAEETLSNIHEYPVEFKMSTSTSMCLAIMDLLLESTQRKTVGSNSLVEFLLGYDSSGVASIDRVQDRIDNQPRLVCFHALLELLRRGISQTGHLNGEDAMIDDVEQTKLLIDTHPILAEKCYELIYRLCSKRYTSTSTLRYLRNRENFFYKQFDAMTPRIEDEIALDKSAATHFAGTLSSADGTRVVTDYFRLRSKLHQRAWLLETIVLEFKTTMHMGQKQEAAKLLELLYGRKPTVSSEDSDMMDAHMDGQRKESGNLFSSSPAPASSSNPRHTSRYQQPLAKMLELISSLDFTWFDSMTELVTESFDPQLFVGLDFFQHQIQNERGCLVYDIRAIYKRLKAHQQAYQLQDNPVAESEIGQILAQAISSNHHREIAHAKLHCLCAWKDLVHITVIEGFDLLPNVARETIIHEMLTMLLLKLSQNNHQGYDEPMLKSMSEIILNLVNKLKESMSTRRTSQLPVEKLRLILGGIITCISQESSTVVIRGNMYLTLTSFLIYVTRHERDAASQQLEQHILDAVLANHAHVINTLREDAFHGSTIWKTSAYIALDALNSLALRAGSQVIQSQLIGHNFLQAAIQMIRADDKPLSNLLEQIDAPLLPLYIFEAKTSILLRLARDLKGADLLCNHRIVEVLSECQYMKVQRQDFVEAGDEATKELNNRYHRLIMPTLQLMTTLLCTYQGQNDEVLLNMETWVRNQQQALVNILQSIEQRQLTLLDLKQISLVAHIMASLSCRIGYKDHFAEKGFNQLHNLFTQLNINKDLVHRIVPDTEEEHHWSSTIDPVSGLSLLKVKATRLIDMINTKLEIYHRTANN